MDALASGWEYVREGRYEEAEDVCRRALQADPADPDAWHLLGLISCRLGRLGEAESSYGRAISARPDFAKAHGDLGVALANQGRLEEAVASLRRAVALAPDSADAHNNLGMALFRFGRPDEAVASLRQAVGLNPDHPMAASTLGAILSARGEHAEMAEVFRTLTRIRPNSLVAQLLLGEALINLREFGEAKACFESAVRLAPASSEAHLGLGLVLVTVARSEAALPSLRRAVELAPDRTESHAMLGKTLRSLGRLDEALDCAEQVVRLRPDLAQAHHDRGFLLDELRRYEEAFASYDQAIRLAPGLAEAHHNRGVVLVKLARFPEALADFDEAIRLLPDYPEARGNRARALLTLGDFARGWEDFEPRLSGRIQAGSAHPAPLWRGEPLAGRTILLHSDAGLGDTIHGIRYAPLVHARGGRVVIACQEPLVRLVETCPGIDRVVPRSGPLPEFDVHSPIMRLMGLFTPNVAAIPATIPYLWADAARVDHWRERLEAWPGFKIGIAWQGSPQALRDRDRSFPLVHFERLARIPGVRLISLQKGFGVEQLRERGVRFPVIDLGEEVDPDMAMMEDTPAIMMGLDLVIAPDTAVAHLAGALGVPIWIALPKAPDWRWLLDRADSPWYPTARLFRQTERDHWDPVFDRIGAAIEERIASR